MNIFATPQPITATLTTAGARVRVTATERPDTVVRVEPVDSTDSSNVKVAANTKVDFSAGVLSVKTTKSGDKNGSVAITIELPADSRLVLNTAWSDVHTDGLLGDCQLSIASGQVHLDRVAAVRGDFSGSEVRIGQATSDVDLSGSNGRFDLDLAEGGVVAKASDCPIRIGRLTGDRAELMNASGGIEVGIGGGTAAVDAESTKGAVRNSVPDDGTGQQVYARTRRDDIVIHQV